MGKHLEKGLEELALKARSRAEHVMTKTTLMLPRHLWTAARHRAIDKGVSFQVIVEQALEAYLKTDK
jgi:hypothetical protein